VGGAGGGGGGTKCPHNSGLEGGRLFSLLHRQRGPGGRGGTRGGRRNLRAGPRPWGKRGIFRGEGGGKFRVKPPLFPPTPAGKKKSGIVFFCWGPQRGPKIPVGALPSGGAPKWEGGGGEPMCF